MICRQCEKEFNKKARTESDGLCSRCRARNKYLLTVNDRRKTKNCPDCGKKILPTSKYCSGCAQRAERNHQYTDGSTIYNRFCKECGDRITSASKRLCRKCYKKTLGGTGNPNYRHGHYTKLFTSTRKYKTWKISILVRDDWTCGLCGVRDRSSSQVHHIYPKRDHPDKVYDISNGIVLCKPCHRKTFSREYEYIDVLLEKLLPK